MWCLYLMAEIVYLQMRFYTVFVFLHMSRDTSSIERTNQRKTRIYWIYSQIKLEHDFCLLWMFCLHFDHKFAHYAFWIQQQVPRLLLVVRMYLWDDYIENTVVNRTTPLYARTDVLYLTTLCFCRMLWPRHLLIITVRLRYFTFVAVLLCFCQW